MLSNINQFRFEFSVLQTSEISEISDIVQTVHRNMFSTIHIANKHNTNNNLEVLKCITQKLPDVHVCAHYAIACQYKGRADTSLTWFIEYVNKLVAMGVESLLLVSGVPRRSFNTIQALQALEQYNLFDSINVYVAYNPFLTGNDLLLENARLVEKLRFKKVKGVFLQIGFNKAAAKQGIEFIRKNRPSISLFASVLISSPVFVRQFLFRPWKGVLLPEQLLQGSQHQQFEFAHNMISWYEQNNVDILVEMFPFSEELWKKFITTNI